MNISSIVLKSSEDDEFYSTYYPLNLVRLVIINGIIAYINTLDRKKIYELEEVNGQTIKIVDLNCKTFTEFVVAIDVNNLNHNAN